MNQTRLQNAIIETIEEDCKDSADRNFLTIQNSLILHYPEFEVGKDGKLRQNYKEDDVFDVLTRLQKRYGVMLTSLEIKKHISLGNLSVRVQEGFGLACKDIKQLSDKIKTAKQKELEYCGSPERGYLFYLVLDGKDYVVKPFQSEEEEKIAPHASKAGLGPIVYGTGERWLFEEFLDGDPLSNLNDASLAGHLVGNFFGRLHKESIVLDHWRFPEELMWNPVTADLRMIDFGTAEYSDDFTKDYQHIQRFLEHFENVGVAKKSFSEEYSLRRV
jgi:hypothetical protein